MTQITDTYSRSDSYRVKDGLTKDGFYHITKELSELYGVPVIPLKKQGGGLRIMLENDESSRVFKAIYFKTHCTVTGPKYQSIGKGNWETIPADFDIETWKNNSELILNKNPHRIQFFLKVFNTNGNRFTREELDKLNYVFLKYGIRQVDKPLKDFNFDEEYWRKKAYNSRYD